MAGGQQINSGQGTLVYNEGDVLTGSAATSAAGTATLNRLLPLRSRKSGTGTASAALSGSALIGSTGTLVYSGESFALVGSQLTGAQGTLLYRGRATIGWNANPESDLAGYRVYHGTTSGVYTEFVDVGNVLTYQWNGLLPGFTHYFVVRAYDTSNNESGNSAQVSKVF
jgi:hypothetical protein